MMMEGLESGSELRKELERERRRIRDRQRRQSMSLEEREKHLARRRRNYQLRRQRAETARLNPAPPIQLQQTSISSVQLSLSNAATCVSDVSPHFDDAAAAAAGLVGSNHGQERPMPDTRSCQSLEIPAHKLAILPGKVRLNRIKHLARAMNDPVGDGVAVGGMMRENGASDCLVSRGLRLNRVKRLARALNPAAQETVSQSHQSITEVGSTRRITR
ncbi:hypothetical protein QUC31_013303 [Theobroma cacao]|uniref:Uncharacterized protein LOC18597302 isoform X1 n=1 Tax=Theobroma cacao TaxID=3641 RepID=A0AB32WIV0_THECC|nr:PREDICTED: uncharacterized protein LOC18597302 isoform X1 [Theobroma cacao]XP_017978874.1 PREDICTED: uncharacterized protein LOC18597302 isoform X1 [Theobroma cacao]XP_017978875.1 PREDICTED: uncharacterized protein LOC18597302 isoform X1 [Theobroma cacao]XP_017978876.1 PREDICTED: uncharacterized protein LOC18597302 isoform X1 [Theobroma cacao]XP_017978877.1 PREDICTED: uncharacterized protein LOC18597302 isoform X1 [Theobroma cacao]